MIYINFLMMIDYTPLIQNSCPQYIYSTVNLLGSNTHTIKKNKEILTDAITETGLEANRET
jgi:hypothetical protein